MSPISSLQIIGSKQFGGAENFFIRMHNAIQDRSDLTSIAVTSPDSELVSALRPSVSTIPMRSVFDPFSYFGLKRLIRNTQPDIVQTWMGRATRLVKLPPSKGPVHVARLGGFYNPKQYQHAHALVGNTLSICDYLVREGVPSERVSFISNFVSIPAPTPEAELQVLRQKLGLSQDDLVVFALGRLHENKGFDTLIKAFSDLPAEVNGRSLHLLIAGDGPLADEITQQVAESSAASRIQLLGWQRDTTPYFHLADLFVCPSRHEPLGNVILEAWAHGLPVVSTRTHGALELVEPDVSGFLVEIDDAKAMGVAMEQALTASEADLHAVSAAGVRVLSERFSETVILSAYHNLYEQLLQKGR